MNRFTNYITSLVLIFVVTATIISSWMVPRFIESSSNKTTIFLFLLSIGLLGFHFLRNRFKKTKLQSAFTNGYKVKLVKEILADNPKTIEKVFTMPFLPIKHMHIQDGLVQEYIHNIHFDPNEDFITLITGEDNRCDSDDLKMREVLAEYTSRGWKVSK